LWKIGEPLEEMMVRGEDKCGGEDDLVDREESWRDLEEIRRERERGGSRVAGEKSFKFGMLGLSLDPSAPLLPIPAALEVPSVAAEVVSLGASGFDSF
jgi:hypothetical protein